MQVRWLVAMIDATVASELGPFSAREGRAAPEDDQALSRAGGLSRVDVLMLRFLAAAVDSDLPTMHGPPP
jgi:hypothetical protein